MRRLYCAVQVMGYQIPVYINPELEDAWGTYCDHTNEIELYPIKDRIKFLDTLHHEIIEAANSLLDLQMNHTQIQSLGAVFAQSLGAYLMVPAPIESACPQELPDHSPSAQEQLQASHLRIARKRRADSEDTE